MLRLSLRYWTARTQELIGLAVNSYEHPLPLMSCNGLPQTPDEILRIQFLDSELATTENFLHVSRAEMRWGDYARADRALQLVHDGIETATKFIGQVSSPDEQGRLAEKLREIKDAALDLEVAFTEKRK